jgi:hypothetical protein
VITISFALTGCNFPAGGVGPDPNTVVTDAEVLCNFLPAIDTVTAIIATGAPGLTTAEAIAEAICGSLPKGAARVALLSRAHPTVAGVPVNGQFINAH